jgi:hypothetical protein
MPEYHGFRSTPLTRRTEGNDRDGRHVRRQLHRGRARATHTTVVAPDSLATTIFDRNSSYANRARTNRPGTKERICSDAN